MARPKKQPSPEKEQASALNTQEVKEETEAEKREKRILKAAAHIANEVTIKEVPKTQEAIEASEDTEAITAQDVLKKIANTAFRIDFMKDPEDAIAFRKFVTSTGRDITGLVYDKWSEMHFTQMVNAVARATGADPEQVRDPEKRTPEQQQKLIELGAYIQADRFDRFFNSTYYQSLSLLERIEGRYKADDDTHGLNMRQQVLLYFFATHDEIKPEGAEPLTKGQQKELTALFYKLDSFYLANADKYTDNDSEEPIILYKFIEAENPNSAIIIAAKIEELKYPIDKPSQKLWSLKPGEQAELKAESDKDSKKGKKASTYLLFDFDNPQDMGATLSRTLTSYDKRVFIACNNLKEQGYTTVTTTQIYEAMGNASRPNTALRQKILNSIEVMSVCRVTLNNTEEAKLYTRYEAINRTFNLLSTEITTGIINGLVVDDAIKIKELSPLYVFSINRGQFTTAPIALLECPISQTEASLQLEDYLFTRIARMKNNTKIIRVIQLSTVYDRCEITTSKQKQRLPEKIERILSHYKSEKWIKGYKLTDKDINITL